MWVKFTGKYDVSMFNTSALIGIRKKDSQSIQIRYTDANNWYEAIYDTKELRDAEFTRIESLLLSNISDSPIGGGSCV